MGLGLQGGGAGVARFFVNKGAKVTVTDLKTEKELTYSLSLLCGLPITFVLGKHREEDFVKTDLIIRNPDVPQDSPYLSLAREHRVSLEMDESLFLRLCPNRENIIGITGTRGKTTTTHLIGEILKMAGFKTLLGGNLRGVATLSLLDEITPESKVVLELSSWQLQGLDWDKLSPHIALITNIYPDHLNRYKNMEDYINDKKIIFKYQKESDLLVLNEDNALTKSLSALAKSKIIWFKKTDLPLSIIKVFRLRGEHNRENLTAAYNLVKIFNVEDEVIRKAVGGFNGVSFRLEEVGEIGGVTYVNDTTSTTPVASIMAMRAYEGKPIILIVGGASKNLDYADLGQEISQRTKAVVLLEGTATPEVEAAILKKELILGKFSDLKQAVLSAKAVASPGDVIILSPGCASFGMFKNEYERGEKFNDVVFSFGRKT